MSAFSACEAHERPPPSPAPSPRGTVEDEDASIQEGSFATAGGPGPAASVAEIGEPPETAEAYVTALAAQSYERRILIGDSHGRVTTFTEADDVNSDSSDTDDTATPADSKGPAPKGRLSAALARPARHVARYAHVAFRAGVDCLNTKTFDPRVTQVLLLPRRSPDVTVHLASNVNTVKLFQVRDRNYSMAPRSSVVLPRRIYTSTTAHKKCILHSLALCADGETFFSADDLEVNWWDIEATAAPVPLLQLPDPGPAATQALTVHALAAHPSHGSLYLAALSDATIHIGDLRVAPTTCAGRPAGGVGISAPPCPELGQLCARRPAAFLNDDLRIVTRDMYALQVWDARRPTGAVTSTDVLPKDEAHRRYLDHMKHEYDHPTLAVDSETQTVVTGVYNGQVAVWQPSRPAAMTDALAAAAAVPAAAGPAAAAGPSPALEYLSRAGSSGEMQWGPMEDMVPIHVVTVSNGADVVAFTDGDNWYKFTRNAA